jgi:hypothetical protein
LSANIHADETVVAVGARETQVVGAHELVALDVHDLTVEDLHAQTQLPVARLVGCDRVEGVAQDHRLLERDNFVPRHVDGGLMAARRNADRRNNGVFGVAGDDHVGQLADRTVGAVDDGAANQLAEEGHKKPPPIPEGIMAGMGWLHYARGWMLGAWSRR